VFFSLSVGYDNEVVLLLLLLLLMVFFIHLDKVFIVNAWRELVSK